MKDNIIPGLVDNTAGQQPVENLPKSTDDVLLDLTKAINELAKKIDQLIKETQNNRRAGRF